MSVRISKSGEHVQQGIVIYTADNNSDIQSLPTTCTPGSECFCIETSTTYILNNQREWKVKSKGGGGGPSPSYQEKSITPDFSNGDVSVTADSRYDALSEVTVQKDATLLAENIKKDVTVHGVTGSYEGSGGTNPLKALLERTATEIDDDVLESIGAYAFANYVAQANGTCVDLVACRLSNAKVLGSGSFKGDSKLTTFNAPEVIDIKNEVFDGCTVLESLNIPNVKNLGTNAFSFCYNLTSLNLPNLEEAGLQAFQSCSGLVNVSFPKLRKVSSSSFAGCSSLEELILPELLVVEQYLFNNCSSLLLVDLPKTTTIGKRAFNGGMSLSTLILRYQAVVQLSNVDAFNNTPFVDEVTTATLYVPQALISAYQNDGKWSQILAHNGTTIAAIEGSPYENA